MEGDRRYRTSDSDITTLQKSDLRLRHLTRDARKIVNGMGLRDLTIFYQVILMEYCYNHTPVSIENKLKEKRNETPAIGDNALITKLSEQSSFRMPKAKRFASFNLNGIMNLYTLDRSIVVADYGVDLEDLASELNGITPQLLSEWLGTVTKEKMPMPIVLCELQEFLDIMKGTEEELESKMLVDVPQYKPMDESAREMLQKALDELRKTQEMMQKENENGLD